MRCGSGDMGKEVVCDGCIRSGVEEEEVESVCEASRGIILPVLSVSTRRTNGRMLRTL